MAGGGAQARQAVLSVERESNAGRHRQAERVLEAKSAARWPGRRSGLRGDARTRAPAPPREGHRRQAEPGRGRRCARRRRPAGRTDNASVSRAPAIQSSVFDSSGVTRRTPALPRAVQSAALTERRQRRMPIEPAQQEPTLWATRVDFSGGVPQPTSPLRSTRTSTAASLPPARGWMQREGV